MDSDQKQLKDRLLACMSRNENRQCCDCGTDNPEWVSSNLAVFLCMECSGVHRQIGTHVSKIRSVKLDMWDEESVKIMEATNNHEQNKKYLAHVPLGYHIPSPSDPHVLREQLIRSKYERAEFSEKASEFALGEVAVSNRSDDPLSKQPYIIPEKTGLLVKLGALRKNWKERWFVLSKSAILYYFRSKDDFMPAGAIDIKDAKIEVPDLQADHLADMPPGFVIDITPRVSGEPRTYHIVAKTGEEVALWTNFCRCLVARLNDKMPDGWPKGKTRTILNPSREGYLTKQGGRFKTWKRRWFCLTPYYLFYYEKPTDLFALGAIPLVSAACSSRTGKDIKPNSFFIETTLTLGSAGTQKGRTWYMVADSEEESRTWIQAIRSAAAISASILGGGG